MLPESHHPPKTSLLEHCKVEYSNIKQKYTSLSQQMLKISIEKAPKEENRILPRLFMCLVKQQM